MAENPENRRRRIIVDAPAQKRMVARSVSLPLTALAIGAFAMLELSRRAMEQSGLGPDETPSFGLLVASAIVFIVGVGAVAIWLSLRQSHRVAGPAHRLQKSVERIRQGDFDFEIELRDGDELSGLADELNRLLVFLRERESARQEPQVESAEQDALV